MKKLHLFVIKSYVGPLILTFFIVIFILLMQFLWKYIDDLIGKGLDAMVLGELLLYFSAGFVPMALPLAILLASLMTFGNMGENNELLALKSAGISLQRIMSALIVLTAIISFTTFFYSNNLLPKINYKASSLLKDIRKSRPELQIKAGVFYNGIEGYSIKIDYKDPETNLLRNIMIYDHTERVGNHNVTKADSGYIRMSKDEQSLVVTLFHGSTYRELETTPDKKDQFPHRTEKFEQQQIIIHLDGFGLERSDTDMMRKRHEMMTARQLIAADDSIQTEIANEGHKTYQRLMGSTLYQLENVLPTNESEKEVKPDDSIELKPTIAYAQASKNRKHKVIDEAINSARNARNMVRTASIHNEYKIVNLLRHQIKLHEKFNLAFACFIFFFIGAPLGAIIRKGGLGTPIIVSVAFFLIYYIMTLTGKKLVKEQVVDVISGMWVPSLVLMVLGIFITYKATKDSVLLSSETYQLIVKKIVGIFKKSHIQDEDTSTV